MIFFRPIRFLFSLLLLLLLFISQGCSAQTASGHKIEMVEYNQVVCGAERANLYFNAIKEKSLGVVCNHTSVIGNVHLVDSLTRAGFDIRAIFSPEHGFRGDAENGAELTNGIDPVTGIRIISLYGKNKKPTENDLEGIDMILFDIQDVGARFYTYISTLSLVMESAAELNIPVIVLDRPNPNGFYVDGPVLDTMHSSFVGMHPVPIVYGMTIGEYAMMVNGECWIGQKKCDLTVIPLSGFNHNMLVKLKIKPSPNLPDWQSIYLYPSLCLFEGTIISVGRGTDIPFQVIGHPEFHVGSYAFSPKSIPGVSEHPPYEGKLCFGINLTGLANNFSDNETHFRIELLLAMYDYFQESSGFFTPYFTKLAGNEKLQKDIESGMNEDDLRKTWDEDLIKFKKIREKYLLYP